MKNDVVFKIGDFVEVLDDTISGTVIEVRGTSVTIESKDGFPIRYEATELIKSSDGIAVSNYEVAKIKKEKELPKKRAHKTVKIKDRNAPKMEVDLHINQLVKSTKGMSNHEMLTLQLDAAKGQLEFAMRKRIQKVVFIHGVGEGILKEELHYLFGRYDNLKYYDADYQKYGAGATEVYIFQNG
ncbi:Smr/MutS family protein [Spongiimicrobium salis]|uniref:Smr/MutS family protein n=1 Tax=Spongiimicrobium salis TaxID=1667022 RepID=UPI00374D18A6